jgi:hypothetical protein
MSTYVDLAINPTTNKPQLALFVDDFYGSHRYGVAFKKDETSADPYDAVTSETHTVYPEDMIKLPTESTVRAHRPKVVSKHPRR